MLKFTHSYCACDIGWFFPVVHSGTAQKNGSNIPGNSTKEEAEYEPAWTLKLSGREMIKTLRLLLAGKTKKRRRMMLMTHRNQPKPMPQQGRRS